MLPEKETGKTLEKIVLRGLDRIHRNKENLIETINDEKSKLLALIEKQKLLVEDEILSFFSGKENQLGELLQQVRMLDSFESGVGNEFQWETEEIRVKLMNLIDSSLEYDCFFRSCTNTEKFQFGKFSTIEEKPVGNIYITKEFKAITCTSKCLYAIIEEKLGDAEYFYMVKEYSLREESEPNDIAFWKDVLSADYQIAAVGKNVYVMKVDGKKCLKVKRQTKQIEIFFEVKNGYQCKRIVSFKSGIICSGKKVNQNDIVKILDPLGVDWVATMEDRMNEVKQMEVSSEFLFILCSKETLFILNMDNGDKLQEIQMSQTEIRRPLSELSNLDSLELSIDCALFENDYLTVIARKMKNNEKNDDFHALFFEKSFAKGSILGYFQTESGVKFLIGRRNASNTLRVIFRHTFNPLQI